MTVAELITSGLRELGLIDITGQDVPAELSNVALGLLNRLFDEWNADGRALYADVHSSLFALVAGTNPHTIGVTANSPTWALSTVAAPRTISGIRLTDDNGETFSAPLRMRDASWWHGQTTPGTSSVWPTDFYYEPTWPNGSIYFFPEPSSAAIKAQVWYRALLAEVTLSTVFTLPPGYHAAVHETLKERIAQLPPFQHAGSPVLADVALRARARAFGPNQRPARVVSDLASGRDDYDTAILGPFGMLR